VIRERVHIARIGTDAVRIKGARPGSATLARLLGWLATRPEVTDVVKRRTGAVDVKLRTANGESALFVQALEDQIFDIQAPAPAPAREVAIAHAIPGRVRLALSGISDDDTVRLARWLADQPGILRASPSPASLSVVVVFDEQAYTAAAIRDLVAAVDPGVWPRLPAAPRPETHWRNAAVSSVVMGAALTGAVPLPALAVGVAATALPPARRALRALRERRLSVDLLDLAAVGISVGTGAPATGAFITWLLSIGDMLLARSADKARAAISELMNLDTPDAWRVTGERTERVAADKLKVGDTIFVATGRRIAADGVVVSGAASVDEKALTGESVPRDARPGDRVLAATVVAAGQLTVQVERVGTDTTAAKIVKMLEGAGAKPMTLVRHAERVTDQLVLPTFGVAGGAAVLAGQLERMTSILITDFGTGVRICLPASALTAMALAARGGVLVKGAQYLERLAKTDVIVFDKTGTLTEGRPEIIDLHPLGGFDERRLLGLTAGAEALAAHPIAEAIVHHAERQGIAVPEHELGSGEYAIGRGLSARVAGHEVLVGNRRWLREHAIEAAAAEPRLAEHLRRGASSLLVAVDGCLVGVLAYADRPRPETAGIIAALKRRHRVVLLSGDARHAVAGLARAVGIDEARGEMLPEDKAEHVRALQRDGAVVAMVGDGINDAPALSIADVGISLHGGTDVALETADVVLLEGGLAKLPDAFLAGERALRHVRRGLGIVIVPNAVAIVLGALGLINPATAAVFNNGSTVLAALAAVAPVLGRPGRKPKP
jgi:P-type Cu2+ transporter